jgi:hypothetical protein
MVRMLIDRGADLDARDRHGRTPYMRAARFRDPTTKELLAAAGASTELDPATDYMGALVRGEAERAEAIKRAHPELQLTDDDREDLPRWASAGEDEIVARLLDAGVPIASPGVDGGTALHYAAMWGHPTRWSSCSPAAPTSICGPARCSHAATRWRGRPGAPASLRSRTTGRIGTWSSRRSCSTEGSEVTEAMIDVASDELAVVLSERITPTG